MVTQTDPSFHQQRGINNTIDNPKDMSFGLSMITTDDNTLDVCKSDPKPIRIRSDRIRSDFGTKIYISDRIALIKLFRSRIGSDFDIRNKMN